MSPKNKKLAKQELEKIYDKQFKLLQAGKILQNKFSDSLRDNPILRWILKLAIIANIGIWASVALLVSQIFR